MRRVVVVVCVGVAALLMPLPAWAGQVHEVRPGQTLSHVARRYKVSIYDLRVHNKLRPGEAVRPGQRLRVPPRGVIYVRPGQTLAGLARKYDTSIAQLRRLNGLKEGERLRVGQRLVVRRLAPRGGTRGGTIRVRAGQTLSGIARAHDTTIARLRRLNGLREGETLRVGQRLVVGRGRRMGVDHDWGEPEQPGVVTLVRDGHHERVQLLDERGRVSRMGLVQLAEHMRRNGQHAARQPSPRLAMLLARISDHFGGRPIEVVSGFRDAVRFTSLNSRHVAGSAADIRVQGVPKRTVWELCRRFEGVGCGYYPRSVFTHVDARARWAQWVDWSRPGKRPRYGDLRGPTRSRRRRRSIPRPPPRAEIPQRVAVVEDLDPNLDELLLTLVEEARVFEPLHESLAPPRTCAAGPDFVQASHPAALLLRLEEGPPPGPDEDFPDDWDALDI